MQNHRISAPSRKEPDEEFDDASVDEMCEAVEVDDEFHVDSDSDMGSDSPQAATSKRPKRDYSLRYFMLTLLCIVTFFGSFGMWAFGRSIEKNEFRTGFQALALKLVDQMERTYANNVAALESAADRFTSLGQEGGSTSSLFTLFAQYYKSNGTETSSWPFVEAPRFGDLVAPYLHLTKSTAMYMAPLVYDRLMWETYTSQELQHAADDDKYDMPVYDDQGRAPNATVYAPIRQYYPDGGTDRLVNYNLLSQDGFAGDLDPVLLGFPALSKTWMYDNVNHRNSTTSEEVLRKMHNGSVDPIVHMSVPV